MIPYARQDISDSDIEAVVHVLKSDFLTQGPRVNDFEVAIAKYSGANYAVAVNSATSALHISCLALGLKPGDSLWTSPISFVASANCGLYCGADIDFVDIDPTTLNLSPEALEEKLIKAERLGKLPKILVAVHFAGHSCSMDSISQLAKKYNILIIEDASHAIGGKYKGLPIGSCTYSDITVFSFHPVKIITTGEGGAALTNNNDIANKLRLLRSHGISRNETAFYAESQGDWYYEQQSLGYNYRMTDIQAALGNSQLSRINQFIYQRNKIANVYDSRLKSLPLQLPYNNVTNLSAYHLYPIRINAELTNLKRVDVFNLLKKSGIGVNVHYIPIHLQPYYRDLGFKPNDFPQAELYYQNAISIPMFANLTEDQQGYIIEELYKIFSH